MRYALGVAAAVVAGIAFNVGILIQKAAVGRAPKDRPLMRSLLRSPIWISGFVLQFILGTPLYTLSVGLVGPAVVPGLMSIGLVVLALGAVFIQKERLKWKEIAGIALVVFAVTMFGFTRLSIDMLAISMKDPGLLARTAIFMGALVAIALICAGAANRMSTRVGARTAVGVAARGEQGTTDVTAIIGARTAATALRSPAVARSSESAAALHAARAGVWYNLGNLGLGFITAGLARFGGGTFDPMEITVFLLAVAVTIVGNVYGIAATQHALASGRASIAIPLQNGVAQILPVCVFFLVYRPYAPAADSLIYLGAACALLMTGVVLLTGSLKAGPA